MLLTCQAGFEALLARELTELRGLNVAAKGPGWVHARLEAMPPAELSAKVAGWAFPHLSLFNPREIRAESVNLFAQQVADYFLESLRGERIEAEWPSLWNGPSELVGLGRRISAVEKAFEEILKKKLSRVAKLARPELPRGMGPVRGLLVQFVDFGHAFVARDGFAHGPRRMADDPLAPSRSYLKVEEAYPVLGREPLATETVCDLGAAPGGWSYSAAKRGAHVIAVDNGPLKGGALDHPRIEHLREDAFRFQPAPGRPADWLFCDLVEEPHHVMRDLVEPWLSRRECSAFVVNLKFGRVDPVGLLRELEAPDSPFQRYARSKVAHLYHDREEFTVVGKVNR